MALETAGRSSETVSANAAQRKSTPTVQGTNGIALGQLATYCAMAFPLAFAGLPIYLHAPDYYAVELELPLATIGSVLLALRLVDAVQDPLIGSLSDRYHESRTAIIALGALLLGGGFWMLFHPLAAFPLMWFALSVFLCTTGFSIVSINFQSLGGLWQAASEERTRITASREAIGLVGLLVAAVVPTALSQVMPSSAAFNWLTLVYLPLLAVAFWVLARWMRSAELSTPAKNVSHASWWRLLHDRWRALFFSLVCLSSLASAIPAVLVLFFIRDRLDAEALTGVFLLVYFITGAVCMPLWTKVSKRFGKLRAWQISHALAIATFFWAMFLQQGDIAAYTVICALSGLALGADLAVPPAILADHIDEDNRQQQASRLFSLMALLSKAALALATGLALPLLGLAGYQPGSPVTDDLAPVFSIAYAGLPCALKLAALVGLVYFQKDLARNKSAV